MEVERPFHFLWILKITTPPKKCEFQAQPIECFCTCYNIFADKCEYCVVQKIAPTTSLPDFRETQTSTMHGPYFWHAHIHFQGARQPRDDFLHSFAESGVELIVRSVLRLNSAWEKEKKLLLRLWRLRAKKKDRVCLLWQIFKPSARLCAKVTTRAIFQTAFPPAQWNLNVWKLRRQTAPMLRKSVIYAHTRVTFIYKLEMCLPVFALMMKNLLRSLYIKRSNRLCKHTD